MILTAFPAVLILLSGLLSVRADLFDDIISALTTATDCTSCHATVLPPLQTLSREGDDAFVQTMTAVCEALQLADDAVCAGEMQRSGPVLAHSLRGFTVNGTTATKFCDAVFGLCQPPPVTPFNVTFPRPASSNPKKFTSKGRPTFQVVHLSDVHIDRKYTVGAEANCGESICCRTTSSSSGNTTEPAGPFGNARCDSPVDLAESLLRAVDTIAPGASFTILTGDVVERDTWLVNKSEVTVDLEAWNLEMLQNLRTAVYPAIGISCLIFYYFISDESDYTQGTSTRIRAHSRFQAMIRIMISDTAPVNAFSRDVTPTPDNSQWVFDIETTGWKPWIGGQAAGEVHDMSGSYSVQVPGTNLRILSVNTQYWYKQNFWLYDRDEQIADPNGLLAFMVEQLQLAEDSSQLVWIIGHIPSGKADTAHDQSNYYDQIVQRYKNTIAAQFFGHSHKDQFEIAYSDWNNRTAATADSILFIGPALTPQSRCRCRLLLQFVTLNQQLISRWQPSIQAL
ncbi:hypothetical protein DENSPDRAFT_89208 [Dentipellis sp. KUC8613]|nr:hypothetical protein DENSPDRAFT_89208 [Dentipellis sp. KUC8613]